MPSPHPTPPKADHPVLPVITERWSPYAFEPRPVEREKLLSCLEAARWAPSSYNEQPWTFILAERTDQAEFARLLECLVEANRAWANANRGSSSTACCSSLLDLKNAPSRRASTARSYKCFDSALGSYAVGRVSRQVTRPKRSTTRMPATT